MTTDLGERLEQSFGEGPPHRPVEERLVAGRRVVRRRRRAATAAAAAALVVLAVGSVLLQPSPGSGGGIGPIPPPKPTTTEVPTPVHLLIAPARFIRPDTAPVLYLYGRMFRRDRGVTVLATFGEIDLARHPQGGAIVRVGGRTLWVLVVGNEPERLLAQREAPYDYQAFMAWAQAQSTVMSGRLALAATAPGPFVPPLTDEESPAAYDGDLLVAKPGGSVVQRIRHPLASNGAVLPCHDQAVRVSTPTGDWFVLGYDCRGRGALYSERVGVRADTLSTWLVQVKRVQDEFELTT